jgi:pSer/pThr/pTyr-binding forkhead associated (FHA) protein
MTRRFLEPIILAISMLLLFGVLVSSSYAASEGAAASFSFDSDDIDQIVLEIDSPQDISAAQVKIEIPAEVTIGKVQMSGFLEGATHLSSGREHRWFQLHASGERQASMRIPIDHPDGTTPVITLLGVDLKDMEDNRVTIATSLPVNIEVGLVTTPSKTEQEEGKTIFDNLLARVNTNMWGIPGWVVLGGCILLLALLILAPVGVPALIKRRRQRVIPSKPAVVSTPEKTVKMEPVAQPEKTAKVEPVVQPEKTAEVKPLAPVVGYLSASFPLTKSEVFLGSGTKNDIVIRDVSVSDRHAWIYQQQGKDVVEDLGSSEGTFVSYSGDPSKEKKVSKRNALKEGAYIRLGKTTPIIFHTQPKALHVRYAFRKNEASTIGRGSSNDIVLNDPSASRKHAEIRWEAGRLVIKDLGSTNGTFVRYRGESAPERKVKGRCGLKHGSIIKIGDTQFRVDMRDADKGE